MTAQMQIVPQLPYVLNHYTILTIDPIHIGTGGYRLGRVDNAIVREPGTNLPKIPGSSLCGALRSGAAMSIQSENETPLEKTEAGWLIDYNKYKNWKYLKPRYQFINESKMLIADDNEVPVIEKDRYDSCAGNGGDGGTGHCCANDCPVCMAFGFSNGTASFQGLAQFSDARILFFPVRSMLGPVWVTCPDVLTEHGVATMPLNDTEIRSLSLGFKIPPNGLNLGWLFLTGPEDSLDTLPAQFLSLPVAILGRVLLVSNTIFTRLVNDNLEVRTSVAIDPATGAAADKALFTYEAIPRATVLWMDIVYSDPKYFRVDTPDAHQRKIMSSPSQEANLTWVENSVEKGFPILRSLGVGGMNTRGMGRIEIKRWY